MGKYQGYEKYKDSGVECLGDIPEHWQVIPIKFSLSMPITDGPHETPEIFDEGVPFISAEAIKNDEINFEKKRGFISREEHQRFSRKYSPKYGDVYMVKSGATTGNVARVKTHQEFNIWSPLAVLRPNKDKTTTDFLFHTIKSKYFFYSVEQSWSFGTQQNIGMGVISNIRVSFPPLDEQESIAHFLDRKTSQIDTLIAKKAALLEKLDEKRTALISHAVTKGLDRTVPMKASGVEWLGDIPEHWNVKRLRYIETCQNGVSNGAEYFGSGYPFVNYTDVYTNPELPKVVNGLAKSTDSDRVHYSVKVGDIFFTRTSETIEEIGISSTCFDSIDNAIFSGFLIRFRPFDNLLERGFSKYYFRSQVHRLFFVKEMNLVTRASLSQELLKRLPVLVPSLEEQKDISQYLDRKTAEIDRQKAKVKEAIELLKEYRTALITNAVTGKIDVRQVASV